MKKLIVLISLVISTVVHAEAVEKVMMEDYVPVQDKDFAYEIKQSKFDKVVLDCGGFVGWMTFYQNGKIAHNVYMDTYSDCPNMHQFLSESKSNNIPVCLQVDGDSVMASNEPTDCE